MNKRKLLTLAMTLCMVAILAIGGTLAYFTDADKDVNVMTAGNVKIVQNETDREGNAWSENNEKDMFPAVYFDEDGKPYNPTYTWEGPKSENNGGSTVVTGPDGNEMTMYAKGIENEIDKVISVTNKGNLPAYIRTIVLIENQAKGTTPNIMEKLHINRNTASANITEEWLPIRAEIDGVTYSVGVYTYADALESGATSKASLKQIWLDPSADNTWYELLGDGKLNIIAFSQAVQVTGFEEIGGAATALDTAFGQVTSDNIADWLADENLTIKTSGLNNVVGGGN